uniref:EGF-like domain-containing protein n=1 Tax=Periophthalmus magnuspinnatus TaxID=409849 RepID=A0A3B4AUK7_9GOBI
VRSRAVLSCAVPVMRHMPHPCLSYPCLNGGTCAEVSNSSYSCKCPEGFVGANCEEEKTLNGTYITKKYILYLCQMESTWNQSVILNEPYYNNNVVALTFGEISGHIVYLCWEEPYYNNNKTVAFTFGEISGHILYLCWEGMFPLCYYSPPVQPCPHTIVTLSVVYF